MNIFEQAPAVRLQLYQTLYYKKNKSWKEIAEIYGTYPNRVRRDARKLGIFSKTKSEAQKSALDSGRHSHPTKGKKQTEETKRKISEAQAENWKTIDPMMYERRSELGRRAWERKSEAEKAIFFKKSVEAIKKASREGSKPEIALNEYLMQNGFQVELHKEHLLNRDKFHIDLYVPAAKTAIEIDGPMHYDPIWGEEKLRKRKEADSIKNGQLLALNFVVLRVKLKKRQSQKSIRDLCEKVLSKLEEIRDKFPTKVEDRYYEICQ